MPCTERHLDIVESAHTSSRHYFYRRTEKTLQSYKYFKYFQTKRALAGITDFMLDLQMVNSTLNPLLISPSSRNPFQSHFNNLSFSSYHALNTLPRSLPTHVHLSHPCFPQVAVSTDSQEALYTKGGENEGPMGLGELSTPPATFPALEQFPQPSLFLVPATPGASPKPMRGSVHTQHNPHDQYNICSRHRCSPPAHDKPAEEESVDQEVSQIIQSGFEDHRGRDCIRGGGIGGGLCEGRGPSLRQLKKYHSADVQSKQAPLLLPRPSSWLDDPRRHSIEVYPSVESSPQRSSVSSGFVSRADSLQQPSPRSRKKKKLSPPCISVDPPEGLVLPRNFQLVLDTGMGTMPPSLPSRDTCLRRRAPSSESKESFDLGGGGDGLPQEVVSNPKLLTLPNFSFEKTSSEH